MTRAFGEFREADTLFIDEKTPFRGTIGLDASRPEIDFDGFAKLDAAGPAARSAGSACGRSASRTTCDCRTTCRKVPEGDDLHTGRVPQS